MVGAIVGLTVAGHFAAAMAWMSGRAGSFVHAFASACNATVFVTPKLLAMSVWHSVTNEGSSFAHPILLPGMPLAHPSGPQHEDLVETLLKRGVNLDTSHC